jgi:glycosyltransferase involved in cell wall biosynthesis
MVKILFISPRYDGGIGGHAKRVAEKLQDCGFNVVLFRVPYIPIKKLKNPTFSLFGLLKATLLREQYDVVHAWNIPSAFIMKQVKAKKKVLSVHGVYSEQIKILHSSITSKIANLAELKALKFADVLTTDSKTVQKSYKEKLELEFVHLPAPLDVDKFKEIPDVMQIENQIVYIGRDSYEKGIDILKNIENRIKGKVVYCTNVTWKEAMVTLKSSSLLVIPSRMESIPQVIKEAFYLRVPIVATNVGGIPELITNEVTGLLVPPNDPKQLLDTINQLLENKDKAEKLSEKGYDFVMKNFTWDVLLPKYLNFYKSLIKS